MNFVKMLSALEEYKTNLIEEERARYKPEYRDSICTIEDVSEEFADETNILEEYIRKRDEKSILKCKEKYVVRAKECQANWWDEALHIIRNGYTAETKFYMHLHNIIEVTLE